MALQTAQDSVHLKKKDHTEACYWLNSPSQLNDMFHLKAKQQSLTEKEKKSLAFKINQQETGSITSLWHRRNGEGTIFPVAKR